MSTYLATFYSHFGATRFKRLCASVGVAATVMPVPRDLSSSCGTCVRYQSESPCPVLPWPEEVEQAAEVTPGGYRVRYRAENG